MNIFLLFAGDYYYPDGGFNDYRGDFATLNEALAKATQTGDTEYDWWHIVDRGSLKIIKSSKDPK